MLLSALMLTGCSGKQTPEQISAEQTYSQAEALLAQGDADGCLQVIDSLQQSLNGLTMKQVDKDLRLKVMNLRPEALRVQAVCNKQKADSVYEASKVILDSLKPLMIHVSVPQVDGYYVAQKGHSEDFMSNTGLSPRVTEIGEFYIVSSVNPAGGLKHWSLTAKASGESVTTDTVRYDGAINYRINNSELVTFSPKQSAEMGRFVNRHRADKITITFNGENGRSKTITLTPAQVEGMATAFEYATAIDSMRNSMLRSEYLQKRIDLASSTKQ